MKLAVVLLILLFEEFADATQRQNNTEDAAKYEKFKLLQKNFDKLYSKLENTNAKLRETTARVIRLHLTNEKLKAQIDQLEPELQETRGTDTKPSSFLALNTQGATVSVNEVVPFRQVKYNDAPKYFGFDPLTSFYRCPYNGTYMFLTNLVTQNGAAEEYVTEPVTMGMSIMKEGMYLVSSQVTTPHSAYGSSQVMSAAGVTSCGPGDEVGVVMTYCGSIRGCTLAGSYNGQTHFTGFRIY